MPHFHAISSNQIIESSICPGVMTRAINDRRPGAGALKFRSIFCRPLQVRRRLWARADFHRFGRQRRGLMSAMTKIVLGTGNLRKNYLDNVIHILDNVLPASNNVLPTWNNVLPTSNNVLPTSDNVLPTSDNALHNSDKSLHNQKMCCLNR